MTVRRVVTVAAALLAGTAVIYYFVLFRSDVHGVVLTHGSGLPIAGAVVRLECQSATLHGYRTRFALTTTTGNDGRYRFPHTRSCGHAYVQASRSGYVGAWDWHLEHALIDKPMEPDPRRIWLVDEQDVTRLNLEGLLVVSKVPSPSQTPIPDDHYSVIAIPFKESKRIARTAQEFDWIRANYCERAEQHWAQTPAQSQTKLLQAGDVGDYDNDVVKFCAGKGIPAPVPEDEH